MLVAGFIDFGFRYCICVCLIALSGVYCLVIWMVFGDVGFIVGMLLSVCCLVWLAVGGVGCGCCLWLAS